MLWPIFLTFLVSQSASSCDRTAYFGQLLGLSVQPMPLPGNIPGIVSSLLSILMTDTCLDELRDFVDQREVARLKLKLRGFRDTLNIIKANGDERNVNAIR